jgi:hypothetical protein
LTRRALERQLRAAESYATWCRKVLWEAEDLARYWREGIDAVRLDHDGKEADLISAWVIEARVALRLGERDVTVARERLEAT